MENEFFDSKHSAAPSMQGYLFQCRFALLEMLRRFPSNPLVSLTIETLDDVVFEKDGSPAEIIQLKHHISRSANLTDASVDLWKTIGIWMDIYNGKAIPCDATFLMVTTEKASVESAAYFLTFKNRNLDVAIQKLDQTAQTSTNKETQEFRKIFSELADEKKKELLKNAYIVDSSPICDDVEQKLQRKLYLACSRSKLNIFLSYLEGWWFQRVVKSFSTPKKRTILGEELEAQLNELRESFKSEALPIHADLKTATVDDESYKDYIFVQQLRLIDIGAKRISIAVNNYYRAFEQRSRWMREELLYIGDIEDYEKRLVEEWETYFETMKEELGEVVAEQEKVKAAQKLYSWVEKEADIPIKDKCKELFITRGSYQILSNRKVVGWHVEFQSRLEELLGIKKEVAQ
jgi:hypothetical protein